MYSAEPHSSCAVQFHSKVTTKEGSETKNPAQTHLVNRLGLITNAKNKGEYLNLVTNDDALFTGIISDSHSILNLTAMWIDLLNTGQELLSCAVM